MTETLRLAGLLAPVRAVRDRYGIVHLEATHRPDVYRALGYVMAGDRLWQMDLMRRLGQGRVAEVLGRVFLPLDVLAHTLGFPDAAATAATKLSEKAAETLEAFTAGVTARMEVDPGPEFALLGYTPEPWRVVDSLGIEYFVGFALALESLESKLLLARALGYLGVERGTWLYPRPLPLDALDAERLAAYRALDEGPFAALAALAPPVPTGSNAWAVTARRAAGGAPLLAGDPHLLHAAPSPWYLVHLVAPGLDVAGAAYVGGPMVQVGRNRSGAWSVTNLTADDADLVLERLDADGRAYATGPATWEPLHVREVAVAVRFEEPYRLPVRTTRNGPLLDAIAGAIGRPPGAPVALRWKPTQFPGHSADGWLAVNESRGLADVLAAGPAFDGMPSQLNCIYADGGGHVAHLALGALPRREGAVGCLPALGWRGEGGWRGIGSLGAAPWRVDPAEGAVWTANETTGAADRAADGEGQPFGEHAYRARRLHGVLTGRAEFEIADFAALQVDDLDLSACGNLPALRDALGAWEPDEEIARRARDVLVAWDGRSTSDSAAAAIYHTLFFAEWVPALFPDETCPGLARHWRIATWGAEAVLRAPRSPWFPDPSAKARALATCAERAVARLRGLAGDDPAAWRWGDLHRVRFAHPLAFAPRFAAGALPAFPIGGSPFALNQQRLRSAEPPFDAAVGAGVRMVVDLADPDHFHVVLSTGQSGDPESPHFADHLPRWRAGEPFRVALRPADGDREAEWQIVPGGG